MCLKPGNRYPIGCPDGFFPIIIITVMAISFLCGLFGTGIGSRS